MDKDLLAATDGVYTYRINGSVHHKISPYLHPANQQPHFSQIYLYDSEMQASIRGNMFPKAIDSSILNHLFSI